MSISLTSYVLCPQSYVLSKKITLMTFSLYNVSAPVGSIIAFAGNIEKYQASNIGAAGTTQPEPMGWMLCDGSALSAYQYPELYAALGGLYGTSGSGSDLTFNLPDLRGQFLRGVGTDSGSTENRTAAPGGTANGAGSTQLDALQTHQHTYSQPMDAVSGEQGTAFTAANPGAFTGPPTSQSDPSSVHVSQYETRPVNTFVNYLIKYTYALPKIHATGFKL